MLRIGYMSFAAIELMPKIVHEFAKRYPDIELDLRYIRTQGQKIELSRNNIDLGFMLGPYQHPQLESRIFIARTLGRHSPGQSRAINKAIHNTR